MDARSLLEGPRGRRFCLEFAAAHTGPAVEALQQVVFYASHLREANGTAAIFATGAGSPEPWPEPSTGDVAEALAAVPLATPDDATVLRALAAVVDSARYWQEPDGTDALLSDPEMNPGLERIATHLAASPATSWLSEPAAPRQFTVIFDESVRGEPVAAHDALNDWRDKQIAGEEQAGRERPLDPTANWSGEWWSTPAWPLTSSTRALPALGPVGLSLVEDSMGWAHAVAAEVEHPQAARVLEITGAGVWADLCRAYPLDVTASRRHDWFRATGRHGDWVIPDWSLVARDADAVHLTAAAYLSAAGTAIPVDAERASVIGGFAPDITYWLTDIATHPGTPWTLNEQTERWS